MRHQYKNLLTQDCLYMEDNTPESERAAITDIYAKELAFEDYFSI